MGGGGGGGGILLHHFQNCNFFLNWFFGNMAVLIQGLLLASFGTMRCWESNLGQQNAYPLCHLFNSITFIFLKLARSVAINQVGWH